MIKEKSKELVIVVSGPSSAGKGTICHKLIEEINNIKKYISMTSRNPRGKDNYFVIKEELEEIPKSI